MRRPIFVGLGHGGPGHGGHGHGSGLNLDTLFDALQNLDAGTSQGSVSSAGRFPGSRGSGPSTPGRFPGSRGSGPSHGPQVVLVVDVQGGIGNHPIGRQIRDPSSYAAVQNSFCSEAFSQTCSQRGCKMQVPPYILTYGGPLTTCKAHLYLSHRHFLDEVRCATCRTRNVLNAQHYDGKPCTVCDKCLRL